jgi:hypothetical protein
MPAYSRGLFLMFWYKKTPPDYIEKYIDQAYAQGAREERRQIVSLLDRLIWESEYKEALKQARTEILARGLS